MTMTTALRIYLTNLGKYNEGELVGEWVELPATEEELEAVIERIGINEEYEEYFITDYESDGPGVSVGEYDNLDDLNDMAEQLADLDDYDLEIIGAFLSEGYDLEEALDRKDDVMVFSDCHDMTDVAYAYIEETGMLDSVPDNIARYFDYEAFGRDMSFDGQFVFTDNGNCIEIL